MTNGQRDTLHRWCRLVAKHLGDGGVKIMQKPRSYLLVKAIVKKEFGNGILTTEKYPEFPTDVTWCQRKAGIVSVSEMLSSMQAWAATDFGLQLETREDEMV